MSKTLKEIAQGRSDLFKLRPQDIKVEEGYNVRLGYDPDALAEIKRSIIENGPDSIQPITVELMDGTPYVRAGHTRLTAAMELIAEGHDVPFLKAMPQRFDKIGRIVDILASNNNIALNQVEQGLVFVKLREQGLKLEKISQKTGKSIPHVSNCIMLAEAPEEAKMLVAVGKMSSSSLLDLIRKHKKAEVIVEKAKQAVEKAEAQGKKKATSKTMKEPKEPKAGELSVVLVGKVMVALESSKGFHEGELTMVRKVLMDNT